MHAGVAGVPTSNLKSFTFGAELFSERFLPFHSTPSVTKVVVNLADVSNALRVYQSLLNDVKVVVF